MGTFAIGDIHGCLKALETLIDCVEPSDDDVLVTLGDYVDRGPDAYGVIEYLIALHRRFQLVALRGNHEEMMLNAQYDMVAYELWMCLGGSASVQSYPEQLPSNIPDTHWEFLSQTCKDWHETESHLFVHAHADPDLKMSKQDMKTLHWLGLKAARPHQSGKTIICGHTPQESGYPFDLGHTVCIDTGAYQERGWLTCLDVDTGHLWQANQRGETRQTKLQDSPSF